MNNEFNNNKMNESNFKNENFIVCSLRLMLSNVSNGNCKLVSYERISIQREFEIVIVENEMETGCKMR